MKACRPGAIVRVNCVLWAFGVFFASTSAYAATSYAGPSGSSTGAGTTDSPWDLATAVQNAGPGDVVILLDGTYSGQRMQLTQSGTAGNPITFRAADGAVPVLEGAPDDNGNGIDGGVVHDIVIDGLWLRNYRYGGISIGWDNPGSDNIVVRHCVADQNGMNGINFFWASNVTVENNIASRNGWGPDSWSSNFNLWAIRGSNNVVRGNVAFHGIDTSSNNSDGNGYILDVSIDQGNALFENNIGFLNGGACVAVTDTSGARVTNNTCFHNAQRTTREFSFADTCRGNFDGIPITGHYALHDVVFRNNVAFADTGKNPLNVWSCGDSTAWVNSTVEANTLVSGDGVAAFLDPVARDFRLQSGSPLVDSAVATDVYGFDIGFDPKCIKAETGQRFDFWTNAPDLDYIRSIGGIKGCFRPVSRPQGSAPDVGAYEYSEGALDAGGTSGQGASGIDSGLVDANPSQTNLQGGGCACGAAGSTAPRNGLLFAAALLGMALCRRHRRLAR